MAKAHGVAETGSFVGSQDIYFLSDLIAGILLPRLS